MSRPPFFALFAAVFTKVGTESLQYDLHAALSAPATAEDTCEAPRAERVEWAKSQNFYPSSAIDPNGFGLDAVLFWASGTQ